MNTITGTDGRDTLIGDNGDDAIHGEGGDDLLQGAGGNDYLVGGDGSDTLDGGEGDDLLYGFAGDDVVVGGAGNEYVDGGDGADAVYGGEGDDVLDGFADDDLLAGGLGNDDLYAGTGDDTLRGEDGDDELYGSAGNDSVAGGAGRDTLYGGAGANVLDGGEGDDVLYYGTGGDTAYGGDGDDLIDDHGGSNDDALFGGAGNDRIWAGDGRDVLDGGAGDDSLDGEAGAASLHGGDGGDTLHGQDGDDHLLGQAGRDTIHGGMGSDTIEGGAGDDTLLFGTWGDVGGDVVYGGEGDDLIDDENAPVSDDEIYGGAGHDRAYAGEGDDAVHGDGGNDSLHGEGGRDTLEGGEGDDTLHGGEEGDVLDGGAGQDILAGGAGDDTLATGTGSDVVVLDVGGGHDVVTEFDLGDADGDGRPNDLIDVRWLVDADGTPVDARDVVVTDDGQGNARLTFPGGETLVLQGVSPAQMTGGVKAQVIVSAAVNVAPVASPGQGTSPEDTAIAGQVGATDADGDALTYSLVQDARDANGNPIAGLTFNADGSYGFQGPRDFYGTLTFTYAASDGLAASGEATVTLTLTPVNDAPEAPHLPDRASAEDRSLSFTVPAFSDVDGDALSYAATLADGAPLPAWLGFDAISRTFSGTPPADWSGAVDLTITASDGAASALDTFRLTISAANDAPVAPVFADQASPEDGPVSFWVPAFADADGDALSYSTILAGGAPLPSWLSFDAATRSFSGTPPANWSGALDVTVKASDGQASASDTFRLVITPVNDAPVAAAVPDRAFAEDHAVRVQVPAFADEDGDVLTYAARLASGGALPSWLSFDAAMRSFSGTPPANWSGALDVTVRASDGTASASDTFRLSLTPVNDAPVAAPDAVAVAEDAATPNLWATLLGNDADRDGDGLVIVGASSRSALGGTVTLDAATHRLTYAADAPVLDLLGPGETRTDSFTYTVSDGHGGTATTRATVTVTGVASGLTVAGSAGDDMLAGTFEDDAVQGGAGHDTVRASNGADRILGEAGDDLLRGGADDDALFGGNGNDKLLGKLGQDSLYGGTGHDALNGGAGRDRMEGGAGSDSYVVDTATDVVVESAGAGRDHVSASVSWTLSANVEALTLTGSADLTGTGSSGANTLTGNAGANTLWGGCGTDTLYGGAGRDRLEGDAGDDVLWGGGGADVLRFEAGRDRVEDFQNNADTLAFDDALWGGGAKTASQIMSYATLSCDDAVFNFGHGHVVTVEDVRSLRLLTNDVSWF